MDGERFEIRSEEASASIAAAGAELVGFRDGRGRELLWQAGPEWPRHAPVLFPIVGRLAGDVLRHDGAAHRLTQHGFARDSRFDWIERSDARAALRLSDTAETRERFPFPFELTQSYAVDGATLTVTTSVRNPGEATLPCGVGAHPAFAWPLAPGVPKTRHRIVFERPEPGPMRGVEGGLLAAELPLPFAGTVLPLDEPLFARDALVMPDVASRGLRYEALDESGAPLAALAFRWDGYKDLGLWSKPSGADFLCVEPWYGMASPVGWDGDVLDKPGILLLPPGETRSFSWSVKAETATRPA